MKQLVVIIGTVILGCMIFSMMVGDSPGSLKNVSLDVMEKAMEEYG